MRGVEVKKGKDGIEVIVGEEKTTIETEPKSELLSRGP